MYFYLYLVIPLYWPLLLLYECCYRVWEELTVASFGINKVPSIYNYVESSSSFMIKLYWNKHVSGLICFETRNCYEGHCSHVFGSCFMSDEITLICWIRWPSSKPSKLGQRVMSLSSRNSLRLRWISSTPVESTPSLDFWRIVDFFLLVKTKPVAYKQTCHIGWRTVEPNCLFAIGL